MSRVGIQFEVLVNIDILEMIRKKALCKELFYAVYNGWKRRGQHVHKMA